MDIRRLFQSPDYFLLALEPGQAVFVEMDRAAYHRTIFFDGRISPKGQSFKVDLQPLLEYNTAHREVPQICYIFHIAHCGSTLLARALDMADSNLVIREPMVLRQLGVQASMGLVRSDGWRARAALAQTMLNRRYLPAGPVLVKGNVPINFMAGDLLDRDRGKSAILIYFPLRHYLHAILRSPNHRSWVARVSEELAPGITALVGPAPPNESSAIAAARLWLAQMLIYESILQRHPKVRSLNAEDLFNTPRNVVDAAFSCFGQTCSDTALDAIVNSDVFTRYSKNPSIEFDNAARLERRRSQFESLAPEIEQAKAWLAQSTARAPETLCNPLVGEAALLLD